MTGGWRRRVERMQLPELEGHPLACEEAEEKEGGPTHLRLRDSVPLTQSFSTMCGRWVGCSISESMV